MNKRHNYQICGVVLKTKKDSMWFNDGIKNGWRLPEVNRLLLLPIIRHIRFLFINHKIKRNEKYAIFTGLGLGIPHQYDRWILYAVLRGWC